MRILFPDVPQCLVLCLAQSKRVTPGATTHPKVHQKAKKKAKNLSGSLEPGCGGSRGLSLWLRDRPPSQVPFLGLTGENPLPPQGTSSPVEGAPPVESLDCGVDSGAGELVWPQLLALAW